MDIARVGLCPYIYFRQYLAGKLDALDSVGQQNCYALWVQFDGITTLERGDQRWDLRPGAVFLAAPGVRASWSAHARVARMIFDLLPRQRRPSKNGGMHPRVWSPQPPFASLFGSDLEGVVTDQLAAKATDIVSQACTYGHNPHKWMQTGALLVLWLMDLGAGRAAKKRLRSSAGRSPETNGLTVIKQAESLLQQSFSPRLGVEDVARQLGMSRATLSRLFKQHRGYGPGRARLLAQVDMAKKKLLNGKSDLHEIAVASGFSNKTSFGRAFKDVVGMAPIRWQKSMRA